MQIVLKRNQTHLILSMAEAARLFANGRWKVEANRGVIDAGRRTQTQVQRAVFHQMALRRYGFVSQNTRGTPRQAMMAFEIYAFAGGQRIEEYKGLRALVSGGAAAARFNTGRGSGDAGFVRSDVWNAPRTFKRSFAANGGYFAMLPGKRSVAPRMLWTYGAKPGQLRDAAGRFAASGRTYGPIRRLFGGALRKELVKDESLAVFQAVAPAMLVAKVVPRMEKLLRFK